MRAIHMRLQRLESRPRPNPATLVTGNYVTAEFAAEVCGILEAVGALAPDADRILTVITDNQVHQVYAR